MMLKAHNAPHIFPPFPIIKSQFGKKHPHFLGRVSGPAECFSELLRSPGVNFARGGFKSVGLLDNFVSQAQGGKINR